MKNPNAGNSLGVCDVPDCGKPASLEWPMLGRRVCHEHRARDSERLAAAAQKVLEGFDCGVFGRDTTGDSSSGWALKLLPYIAALAELREAVGSPHTPGEQK